MNFYVFLKSISALTIFLTTIPAMGEAPRTSRTSPRFLHDQYGKLPLSFEAHPGQAGDTAQFLARGLGYTVSLYPDRAIFALQQTKPTSDSAAATQAAHPSSPAPEMTMVLMQLAGANKYATAMPEGQQITKTNYFIGSDATRWRTDIPNYGRIRYRSVYPGTDLVYYGNRRRLEHDFIVAPHADPNQIALSFDGSRDFRIDRQTSDLILTFGDGIEAGQVELRLLKPIAYQNIGGHRTEVSARYKQLAGHQIGFTLGTYNHAHSLVIDPILTYSTYLGGSGGDEEFGIAVDTSGNAYIVGASSSSDFPVTAGAIQTQSKEPSGSSTVVVSKLNAAGTALVYSTYLGGTSQDVGYAIALDSFRNAYVTGITYSTDFPVTCDAFQAANPSMTKNASVGFVTKLDPSGSALVYSTYLGGTGDHNSATGLGDSAVAIAVNHAGDAYVTGYTHSADFPTTDDSFQPYYAGTAFSANAFVARLNRRGRDLIYSTYLGGNNNDYANAIALNHAGEAFITGTTASANFPITSGAFQEAFSGASGVAFVSKLSPRGRRLVYSTFLGGSKGDSGNDIAVDRDGNAYVAGNTGSSDFPLTAGVVEGTDVETNSFFTSVAQSGFVTKLNADGSSLAYSTYVEGSGTSISTLAVDAQGNAYVAGETRTASYGLFGGFMATPDAFAPPPYATNQLFLVKLDPAGTTFSYATLFGGSSYDVPNALALDEEGSIYLTGIAYSPDFPTTSGAFQPVSKTPSNLITAHGFISKFGLAGIADGTSYPIPITLIPTSITGVGQQVSLYCDPTFPLFDSWFVLINVNLAAAASGPAPSGTLSIFDNINESMGWPIAVDSFGSYAITDGYPQLAPPSVQLSTINWAASYSGDANYLPSAGSGTFSITGCPPPSGAALANSIAKNPAPQIRLRLNPVGAVLSYPAMPKPKFSLSPPAESMGSAVAPHQAHGPSCIERKHDHRH